jgi:hypothetical protein
MSGLTVMLSKPTLTIYSYVKNCQTRIRLHLKEPQEMKIIHQGILNTVRRISQDKVAVKRK